MKKRSFITIAGALALAMVLNITSVFGTVVFAYNTPSVTPPASHPRVLFTSSDIPAINAFLNGSDSENSAERLWFRRYVTNREGFDNGGGDLSDSENGWSQRMLGNIEAKALAYVLGRDVTGSSVPNVTGYEETTSAKAGELAVEYLFTYLNTMDLSKVTSNPARVAGEIMYVAAETYDWCYGLLTTEQKNTLRTKIASLGSYLEMGWPPIGQKATVGHGAEAQLLRDALSFAIAVYDEDPSLWNTIGGRFYDEYVPVRNTFLPAGYNLQGSEYGNYRYQWDAWAYYLITGMGAASPYSAEATQGLKDGGYQVIYGRRPDGQFFRDGDNPITATELFETWDKFNVSMLSYLAGGNPYIKDEYLDTRPVQNFYEYSAMMRIILAAKYDYGSNSVTAKSKANLPLTHYFGDKAGIMTARTNWSEGANSNAAAAFMRVGNTLQGNHEFLNAGTFQLYYKGILASPSGIYQGANPANTGTGASGYESYHRTKYATQTVASNGLLIDNKNQTDSFGINNEPTTVSSMKTVAEVVSYDVDQTNPEKPSYSYIKGDISDAYSNTSNYKRSMMFLNLNRDDVPAAMLVYDYVDSSYTKRWLLHGQQQPTTELVGTRGKTTFINTNSDSSGSYNGKMVVDTLLPASPYITIVGGEGNYSKAANGTNYEATEKDSVVDEGNTYRMEISSSGSQFLNVMQVSDADKSNYLDVARIGGDYVAGAVISDRVVTFNKNGNIFTGNFNFSAPEGTYEYTICDVKRGAWKVSTDSSFSSYDIIGTSDDEDSNVLHFTKTLENDSTLYFALVNAGGGFSGSGITPAQRSLGTPTQYDFCDLYNGSEKVETNNFPLFDENGYPLVAASDLANILGASISVSGDTVTFTKSGKTASFTVGEATITKGSTVNSAADEATPIRLNGEIYVSPTTVSAYYLAGCTTGSDYIRISPNALKVTVVLNEAFESPVADNANYTTEGGWTGISTNRGGQDEGYDGTYGFAPVSRSVSRTWTELRLTKYFLSPGMKATSGKYTIRFMYNRGSKSAESNVYVNANGDDTYRIFNANTSANGINVNIWYQMEVTVDLDNDTCVVKRDNVQIVSGNYTDDTVGAVVFGFKCTNNLGTGASASTYISRIDNLYIEYVGDGLTVPPETVVAPIASVQSGTVMAGTTVELSTSTEGATIYYTTDGIEPTTDSAVYSSPFTINENTQIKAFAVKTDCVDSPVAVFAYSLWNSSEFGIQYSADGTSYIAKNESDFVFDGSKYVIDVTLPAGTKYAYLKLSGTPVGWTAPGGAGNYVRYGWLVNGTDYFSGSNTPLVGAATGSIGAAIATTSYRQQQVVMRALTENGAYKIPIKNEQSNVTLTYNSSLGHEINYKITFHAQQPRLTSFTDYTSSTASDVIFISGAVVNNDNGTVLESGITGSTTGKLSPLKVLGNTSKSLLGASMFLLPTLSEADAISDNLFEFTADHDGTVYLMVKSAAGSSYDDWNCINNGTDPSDLSTWRTSNTRFIKPRTYNDYSDLKYYSISLNWYYGGATNSFTDSNNAYRANSPGYEEDTNSESLTNSAPMNIIYAKTFKAGDNVIIPGWGGTSGDTAVLVQWDDISYNVDAENSKIDVNTFGLLGTDAKIIAALYDNNGNLLNVKIDDSGCGGKSSISFDSSTFAEADELSVFIWDMDTLNPYFGDKFSLK